MAFTRKCFWQDPCHLGQGVGGQEQPPCTSAAMPLAWCAIHWLALAPHSWARPWPVRVLRLFLSLGWQDPFHTALLSLP